MATMAVGTKFSPMRMFGILLIVSIPIILLLLGIAAANAELTDKFNKEQELYNQRYVRLPQLVTSDYIRLEQAYYEALGEADGVKDAYLIALLNKLGVDVTNSGDAYEKAQKILEAGPISSKTATKTAKEYKDAQKQSGANK